MFEQLTERFDSFFRKLRSHGKLTEDNIRQTMREIRRILLEADVNFKVTKDFIARVQEKALGHEVLKSITPGQQVVKIIHNELITLLGEGLAKLELSGLPPVPVMIVGLQGSGKTTLCAKLALHLRRKGRFPLLAAADVYRPAAIDQLKQLGKQIDIPVWAPGEIDPVKICTDALSEAKRSSYDVVLLDTAGRLHIDDEMMQELERIRDAVKPPEILYIADGMTGQDAVKAAQEFQNRLDFNGIILTKMDGDARGGAALSIRAVTGKPIRFIGTGEKPDALEEFHPDRMASRILGMGDVLTLVEKAQENVDQEEAEKLATKLAKQGFTFEDFLSQLNQIKKMGPLEDLLGMIPGLGKQMKNLNLDERELQKTEAIVYSMTLEERRKPNIINGSRRKRIAAGSGTRVQDVNQLLNQFNQLKSMMKRMGKAKGHQGVLPKMPFPLN
ncbi:signal recognition particle protein [candidate division LCP-89 bacterium B3_LCP]|uniref:Signal recognition particle protein n=1 Tax=candidate division LCP-89 bacterium B3_LCP TaxID=2012998 RepID=A0A532UXW2_UNCL8|nr:MAG: signal recognition particle protein [candidate division LCP-89 bacterium B3_LCP]